MSHKTLSKTLIADMYGHFPSSIDVSNLGTTSEYGFMLHVTRPLVRYSKDLQLEGDILQSWTISKDKKVFNFVLKKNIFFSNGTAITARHIVNLFKWQIKKKSAIHFDFSLIQKVTELSKLEFQVNFKKPSFNFINSLVHPEFGPLFSVASSFTPIDFKITSGPYYVENHTNNSILLKRNPYYSNGINYPKTVQWRVSNYNEQLENIVDSKVDISFPGLKFGIEEHKIIQKKTEFKVYDPNIGFTFFLSLNPKSRVFNTRMKRLIFLNALNKFDLVDKKMSPIWEKAEQLYLKGGFGRPSQLHISDFWSKIKLLPPPKIDTINILISKNFIFTEKIIDSIKALQIHPNITMYTNFDEYSKFLKTSRFDIIQANNDFSSLDLIENILVCFRKSRPLILTNERSKLQTTVDKITSEITTEEKRDLVAKIGLQLLEDGYIYPVAHYKKFIYSKSSVSFGKISQFIPDVRLYKLEINDEN